MEQNGHHRSVAVVDLAEADSEQTKTSFYDPSNPVLQAAALPHETGKKKVWKRKLIGFLVVALFVVGAGMALYMLMRVKRVPVTVQADSRKGAQELKPKSDAGNSESVLTEEAINLARAASGADNAPTSKANPTASANSSPTPPSNTGKTRDLSFTVNSPVFDHLNNADAGNANANPQKNQTQLAAKSETVSVVEPQSRANNTQSIFVDETALRTTALTSLPSSKGAARTEKSASEKVNKSPSVLPPFGTMLPVRTQGVIFTLRNDSYARLELTQDAGGAGWSLPKGTVLVGRTSGNEYDRAFVKVIGYIDPRDNKLVKMTGEVLGGDGATGIPGKRIGVDRNRLKQTLRKVASSGVQVAGLMAGALGRGTVVLDGAGYRVLSPLTDEARGLAGGSDNRNTFVKVEAGRPAYVMVADLPKAIQAVDAPGEDEITRAATRLTDREVMELILFGTPSDIRAALPLMNDEQKKLVLNSTSAEPDKQ